MNDVKNFVAHWSSRGYEKGEAQPFWLSLLRDVFNIAEPEKIISFEVKIPHGFIDGLIVGTRTLIEQKSSTVDIDDAEIFLQAKRYNDALEFSRKARWIITCNFREFRVYDMNKPRPELEPLKIALNDLPENFHALEFLIDATKNKLHIELELSLQAGEIVGKVYDALLTQYIDPNSAASLASLNKLCVRLVFCLYAESAGIFGKHKIFRDYLSGARNIRRDLLDLFDVLNTPVNERDPYLDDALKKFPFVNGGLFDGAIEIPNFTPEIRELLLEEASSGFNWSGISPTIFGAVFEATLNPETRREGGMHYTSIENIHKVIDPLFLDDLRNEFAAVKSRKKLLTFQDKLASLKIFDPACGSGNFLTETYLSLRRLENEILKQLLGKQITIGEFVDPVKVSIAQFYGIEINDFAVAVAQTALWIAELQMIQETQQITHRQPDFLPLKSHANIHEGNALHIDWATVAPHADYLIGNPPFVGASMMNAAQKSDAVKVFGRGKLVNSIDYVGAWYHKAAKFIQGTAAKVAFVSTNSITQGEQVTPLWKKIFADYGMQIIFAHRAFKWISESLYMAAIHCVVIGMCDKALPADKKIIDGDTVTAAKNICPYLLDSPTIFIESRARHFLADVPRITKGNQPTDDGNFIFSADEAAAFIKKFPAQKHLLRRYLGAKDFLHGEPVRYCLWLLNVPPNEYASNREIRRRLAAVKSFREASSAAPTRKAAETPHKFFSTPQGDTTCIAIPRVSSERRRYIPIGFVEPTIIVSDALSIIPGATLYHFGVLTSSIHMAWMRVVAGRLTSRYRYSGSVVYNNFPWCEPSSSQVAAIEATAQKILDVRANYPDATFADLYDELTMPADLRRAHRANDKAVAAAYGLEPILDDEHAIIAALFKRYAELTGTDSVD